MYWNRILKYENFPKGILQDEKRLKGNAKLKEEPAVVEL